MSEQFSFSEEERELLIELLEREERELPSEIRHTRLTKYREGLHHRLDVVHNVLERMRTVAPA
jgi:hypothetical protein